MHPSSMNRGYYRGPMDELLDIVERGCLRFMATGALVENSQERPVFMTAAASAEKKAQILAVFLEDEKAGRADLHEVARKCGVHYDMVAKTTRELRAGRRRVWRDKAARTGGTLS